MDLVLPPGVDAARFSEALQRFAAIVGTDWVFSSDEDRNAYLDAFAPGDADTHAASAAVAPASTEEVQAIVRVANEFKIPLWPISTGRNLAYGGSAPVMRGTVVLDLKRMNRIIEVDEELGYALVEPGVNFFQFFEELQRRGGKYWISGPAPGWGSVIGNALEHGVGYTPYGVHAQMIAGMEVVLANGEVLRTGMGGVEGGREWQTFKLGYGPVWDGMFTQSNYGIVTKMGIELMPEPEAVTNVLIEVPDFDDLATLVDTLRPLRLNDTINATYTITNPTRGVIDTLSLRGEYRPTFFAGAGAMPMDVIAEQLQKLNKGMWGVTFNVFDRAAAMESRLAAIRKTFETQLPTARIAMTRWQRGEPRAGWMRQDPVLFPLGVVDWMGGPGGHMNFAPVCAPIGERVVKLYKLIYERFMKYGVDCYMGMLNVGQRALVLNAVMYFNKDDAEMTARVRELGKVLARDAAAAGFGDYRAHISSMDDVAAMYGWNDHALRRFNEQVKDALDPNGILAPGKQGIWPAAYRDMRKS